MTLDISGMYTNVPIDEGLKAFEEAMNKREDLTVPTEFLVKLMRFVFDRKLFLQLLGVAMWSGSSPTFVCIFMGMLEMLMLCSWNLTGELMPHLGKRFIDDVLFFWRGSEENLLKNSLSKMLHNTNGTTKRL